MAARGHPAYLAVFLLVLAPIGAVVLIAAALLFGVPPQVVFAPGRAIQSFLRFCGLNAPNRVGVAGTGVMFWAAVAALGLAWEWWRARRL